MSGRSAAIPLLMVLLAAAPSLAAGGSAELIKIPNPEDAISPEQRAHGAALTDLLPAGTAKGKDKVSCKVVPSDGRKSGPATVAGRSASE